jgi:hypothetical protein
VVLPVGRLLACLWICLAQADQAQHSGDAAAWAVIWWIVCALEGHDADRSDAVDLHAIEHRTRTAAPLPAQQPKSKRVLTRKTARASSISTIWWPRRTAAPIIFSNYVPACERCNIRKRPEPFVEFMRKKAAGSMPLPERAEPDSD